MKWSSMGVLGLLPVGAIAYAGCSGTIFGNADNQYDDAAYCSYRAEKSDMPKSCADWCRSQAAVGAVPKGCDSYAACANGAKRCQEKSIQTCDGHAWRDLQTCQGTDYCDAETTQCKTPCTNMACGTDHGVTCGTPCSNGQGCDKTHHCIDPSPGMVWVPAGTLMPGPNAETSDQLETVGTFLLDLTAVTVSAYGDCVNAGKCMSDGLNTTTYKGVEGRCNWGKADKQGDPVNCVTYKNAVDYCAWAGKRLPSSWEWEFAARYDDRRDYPWGNNSPDKGAQHPDEKLSCCGKLESTCPVGIHPDGKSKLGLQDMVGAVHELTDGGSCAEHPCGNATPTIRGGCWTSIQTAAAHEHKNVDSEERDYLTGFRCAANR